MSNSFRIEKLISTGKDKDSASITFSPYAHAVIGPSNTGKSYVFQCIKYLLGSSKKPKKIKESIGYSDCYLEVRLPNGSVNTIHRSLSSDDALLYECDYEEISNYIDEPEILRTGTKGTKKIRTLNDFFLEHLGVKDKKVRRNKSGVSDPFRFSFLRDLTLIDEMEIIKEESPLYSGQFSEKTKEESILRFLLTGVDDGEVSSKPKQKVIDNRKGRLEVINELIKEYLKELSEFNLDEVDKEKLEEQIDLLGASIALKNGRLQGYYKELNLFDSTIDEYWQQWKKNESRLITVNELISRFELLNQHYESDLSRLESLQEVSAAYSLLDMSVCPVCNSNYESNHSDFCKIDNLENVFDATQVEVDKINSLQSELVKTRGVLHAERKELIDEVDSCKSKHNELQRIKSEFTSNYIKRTVDRLENLRISLRDKKHALRLVVKIDDLVNQKKEYEHEIDPMDGNYNFDDLTTSTATELCNEIQSLLIEWKYGKDVSVSFSEDTGDLVISGDDRNLAGKGYRALTYSAFSIGLMHVCLKNNLPHSGIVLLDSPLCTLRSKKMKKTRELNQNDIISDETKEAFYKSIASYKNIGQVIILDNDGPLNPEGINIGYTEFTEDLNHGRYGYFIPRSA